MTELIAALAGQLGLPAGPVANALRLLEEANTIPFIARYRKEQTGSMDEVVLRELRDRSAYLRELEQRRATVLESIAAQGQLTPELQARIAAAETKQALEDLYLPYRPKRRTRATAARELGLEPLAATLFGPPLADAALEAVLAEFLAGRSDGLEAEAAWAGCRDLCAERVAEDADTRAWIRALTWEQGRIAAVPTPAYAQRKTKFSDYYAFDEPLARIPPHRYLALRRGESEKVLRVSVQAPETDILARLARDWCPQAAGLQGTQWALALEDAYQRLIAPSIAAELRQRVRETAERASIATFGENLQALLLQPPGGQRVVLGLDPGLRTGSKWAVVDGTGRLLAHGTIYPLPPQNQAGQAAQTLQAAVRDHGVEVVAVGNGTAARELLAFTHQALRDGGLGATCTLVSEAGASVYSASDLAREEFPELDVTIRGAVSIARRWQDPLAELVKIDPRSIGVGQYQHDVNQQALHQALDDTVELCVNRVGVNLNTASWALLRYVSGVGSAQAREIVLFRDVRGPFPSREVLQRVPRLGPKAFEQCAGFLRIPDAANPLDASAVHPEHYALVQRMVADLDVPLAALVGDEAAVQRIDPARYVSEEAGLPTLQDILAELRKPGRDPRAPGEAVQFSEDVTEPAHLRPGMQLNGIVTNVTQFGAFVDLGVHQDGLVHISQLADRFVQRPADVVKVGQAVRVTVLSVDLERKRIALSMKSHPSLEAPHARARPADAAPDGKPQRPSSRSRPKGRPGAGKGRRARGAEGGKPTPASAAPAPPAQSPQPPRPAPALEDVLRRFGERPKR